MFDNDPVGTMQLHALRRGRPSSAAREVADSPSRDVSLSRCCPKVCMAGPNAVASPADPVVPNADYIHLVASS